MVKLVDFLIGYTMRFCNGRVCGPEKHKHKFRDLSTILQVTNTITSTSEP